ncbi:MAG: TerB N-terminal domain-containing protein [Methanomicrobiales archaeon]|nr:TerB N-terminal domain-containing protein [Methanomicrobiales archaeon]
MTPAKVIRVPQKNFQKTIDDKINEGWSLKTKEDHVATLEKPGGWGSLLWHIVILVLTVWWTVFIGNIVYALISHFFLDKQELQIETVQDVSDTTSSDKTQKTKAIHLGPITKDEPIKGTYNSSERVQDFSDITIPGETEKTQAIPPWQTIRDKFVEVVLAEENTKESTKNTVFRDMQKYANYEGKPAAFAPFATYHPTYGEMDKKQQAWYFYWRSQVRQGNYLDTDLSYIFLFIYEILNGIGWKTPQEGYDQLFKILNEYKDKYNKLIHYVLNWSFDFARLHNIPYIVPLESGFIPLKPSPMTDILVEQYAKDVPLKLPFTLINALCDYSLANSKFYKEGNQEMMQEAIPRVITLADAALRKKSQKGILEAYGPSHTEKQEHYLFRSAVYPQANQKTTLTVKPYSTNTTLREYINDLVRCGENTLRELQGSRGRLRGITLDDETLKLVESFLKKEYGQTPSEQRESTKKPEITLDFENIDNLRKQSDAVRDALHVEETLVPVQEELLTEIQEIKAIYLALSLEARTLMERLESAAWECEQIPGDDALIAEINHVAERYLGCALLVKENTTIIVEDDYRDEFEYIYENLSIFSKTDETSTLFNESVLTPQLKEYINHLMPEQKKVLYALVTCDNPQYKIEEIADETMTLPEILLDELNEASMQILGDIIVDVTDQEPHILDEYLPSLKQSIE